MQGTKRSIAHAAFNQKCARAPLLRTHTALNDPTIQRGLGNVIRERIVRVSLL